MVRSMGLLLLAVFAVGGEACCVLEKEREFLHRDRAGSMGYWAGGSCRLRWRVCLRWGRLFLSW